jgi:hypothetical protein
MFGFVKDVMFVSQKEARKVFCVKRQAFLTRWVKWDSVSKVLEVSVCVCCNE